jgi:hypothetical protein
MIVPRVGMGMRLVLRIGRATSLDTARAGVEGGARLVVLGGGGGGGGEGEVLGGDVGRVGASGIERGRVDGARAIEIARVAQARIGEHGRV